MDWTWPPYSSGLNPCDFFLWMFLKGKVYQNNPYIVNELAVNIEKAVCYNGKL